MAKLNPKEFTLLYDNILVESEQEAEEVDGIYRPRGYEDKPEVGKVVSVGTGRVFDNGTIIPLTIKVGDTVYFNKYSTTKIRLDLNDYYLIREEDVQGYKRD